MMIVANIENGNGDAIEDAVIGARELQSGKYLQAPARDAPGRSQDCFSARNKLGGVVARG
jgi:hypothetical protein